MRAVAWHIVSAVVQGDTVVIGIFNAIFLYTKIHTNVAVYT